MSVNSGSLLKPGESSNEYKTSYQSELASNQLYVVDVYNNSELTRSRNICIPNNNNLHQWFFKTPL